MKRFAQILSALGSVEVLVSLAGLFIFEHVLSPWGAGTLPGGLSVVSDGETAMDRIYLWQNHVLLSIFGSCLMGALFLLVGSVTFLAAKFLDQE